MPACSEHNGRSKVGRLSMGTCVHFSRSLPSNSWWLVASATETGASMLYVVANGIASAVEAVTVGGTCPETLQVETADPISASGPQGGPFSPSTFTASLSSTSGSVKSSITNVPTWLTASSKSGTVTTAAKSITFKINASADKLTSPTYPATLIQNINFNNTTNGQGNTTRVASLQLMARTSVAHFRNAIRTR
jgi:hypothetical protein